MFMEVVGLDSDERANKAALLLAHERYAKQFAPFVKGQVARLSYIEAQVATLLEECAAETNADPDYVRDRFAAFLRQSVKSEIPADSIGDKNDVPSDFTEFTKTDVMDRGEVPGLGLQEALTDGVEKVDLGSSEGLDPSFGKCARCEKRQASLDSAVCLRCAYDLVKKGLKEGARSDYDHWNEEGDRMWWEEEGKHPYEPDPNDGMGRDDYGAEDAAWENLQEYFEGLDPEELHAIASGATPVQHIPGAEGLAEDGVRDVAANVLSDLGHPAPGAADPAEFAERGLRGGAVKEGDESWSDGGSNVGPSPMGSGPSFNDPSQQGLVTPVDPNAQYACKICGQQGTQQEIQQHVMTDHADVMQNVQNQQGQMGTQPPQGMTPNTYAGVKKSDEAQPVDQDADAAQVAPLPETPGDHFQSIVQDLAERAAARHFSKPSDADFHNLAAQLGVDESQIRDNLITVGVFGNYAGRNGELADDATPPEGYDPVQLQNGSSNAHQAVIPTDLVVNKVADDMNLDNNLAYNMIRDKYGADLPEQYHANVQGQQTFYLPSGLAGQQQDQQPAQYDPTVGPAFPQTPPGAPVPTAPQQQPVQPQQ